VIRSSLSAPVAEQMPLLTAYAAAFIQERVTAGPRAGIRCGACARRRPWWTALTRTVRAWRDSLHTDVALPTPAREQLESCLATRGARAHLNGVTPGQLLRGSPDVGSGSVRFDRVPNPEEEPLFLGKERGGVPLRGH
jgi:hypothetical protein